MPAASLSWLDRQVTSEPGVRTRWPAVLHLNVTLCLGRGRMPSVPVRLAGEIIHGQGFAACGGHFAEAVPGDPGGYQLIRQQALAEGIAASDRYDVVVSCMAYDSRNEALIGCLRETGSNNFSTGWGALFAGRASFATFTHQQWVAWVRQHDLDGRWADWLAYVSERYGYDV